MEKDTCLTNLFSLAKEKILESLSDEKKSMGGVIFDSERTSQRVMDDFPDEISVEDMKSFVSKFAVAIMGNQMKFRSIGSGVYVREDIKNINVNDFHVTTEENRTKAYNRKTEELRGLGMKINTDKDAMPGQIALDIEGGKLIQELTVDEFISLITREAT